MLRDDFSDNAPIGRSLTAVKKLGKGASGYVFQCVDERGRNFACKVIETKIYGIYCLEEPFLMSVFDHPYLNKSLQINVEKGKTFIFQQLATNNLAELTRRDMQNKSPDRRTFLQWAWKLSSAIDFLHQNNIVHCDIKAENILIYSNEGSGGSQINIRLSDYSSATWMFKNVRRRHNIGTATHRPPEVYREDEWDYSVDLWALGCTLFEIFYGQLLFPYQGKNAKLNTRRMINCLNEWAGRSFESLLVPPSDPPEESDDDSSESSSSRSSVSSSFSCDSQSIKSTRSSSSSSSSKTCDDYLSFMLPEEWYKEENRDINKFIYDLLRINPRERGTIRNVLKHPIFNVNNGIFTSVEGYILLCPNSAVKLTPQQKTMALSRLRKITDNELIIANTMELYSLSYNIRDLTAEAKLMSCLWIVAKIVEGKPFKINSMEPHHLMKGERKICRYINFRYLFSASLDS